MKKSHVPPNEPLLSRASDMTILTPNEIARQVVKRLPLSNEAKIRCLQMRAVKPGRVYTEREFRLRCHLMKPVIDRCIDDIHDFVDENHPGGSMIDRLYDLISHHTFLYNEDRQMPHAPPFVRRTCTGWLGCTTSAEDVAYQPWE